MDTDFPGVHGWLLFGAFPDSVLEGFHPPCRADKWVRFAAAGRFSARSGGIFRRGAATHYNAVRHSMVRAAGRTRLGRRCRKGATNAMADHPTGFRHGLTNYGDLDFSLYLRRSFAQ